MSVSVTFLDRGRRPGGAALAWFLTMALVLTACATPQRDPRPPRAAEPPAPLLAAERALQREDADAAARALAGIRAAELDRAGELLWRVLQAELALLQDRPRLALEVLPPPWASADRQLSARTESARALALAKTGDAVAAVSALVERGRMLDRARDLRDNDDLIWRVLLEAPLDQDVRQQAQAADPVTSGWVELALIVRGAYVGRRDDHLADWRTRYPDHPADLERALQPPQWLTGEWQPRDVDSIALLLPLTGALAAAAEAVRDGFTAASYQVPAPRPRVRVFDTGSNDAALTSAYRAALDAGSEFIVGPLLRENVMFLAAQGQPPVPVLALNYLDPGAVSPFNFFQTGLAPEHEARQAAERAVADGHRHAVALVPAGEWGDRVLAAFAQHLQGLGGRVLAVERYAADARDHSVQIRRLLRLDESSARHAALRGMVGVAMEFEPRRRDDVDMVFIAARTDHALALRPQLRFHRASDLPVYATAAVFDGSLQQPADLSGIRFCDMPWMLDAGGRWREDRRQLEQVFPQRAREQSRLFALGHAAYATVQSLQRGELQQGVELDSATGRLRLQGGTVIERHLDCAIIERGRVRVLKAVPVPQPDRFPVDPWERLPDPQ